MEKVVEESYSVTLKPWHGWISSAAFRVIINHSFCSWCSSYSLSHEYQEIMT